MNRLIFLSAIFIILFACNKEDDEDFNNKDGIKLEPISDCNHYQEFKVESDIEADKIIAFNDKYVLGGFDGFMLTDQAFNILAFYKDHNMYVEELAIHPGNFVTICTTIGIYSINEQNEITQLSSLPCTDIAITEEGRSLFISGLGELSDEKQIPANIMELDLAQDTAIFYSDPHDSLSVFLNQLEITANNEVWVLSHESSVFRFEGKHAVEKFSIDEIDFFPPNLNTTNSSYILKARGEQIIFTYGIVQKKILLYDQEWHPIIDLSLTTETEAGKNREIIKNQIYDLEFFGQYMIVATEKRFY